MAKQLMPAAELEARSGDVPLTDEQWMQLSLFAQLKRKPTLDKFPGAVIVRRYRKDEIVFRQGEAGWTAYYILTSEDILAIKEHQLKAATRDADKTALEREVAELRQRVERLKNTPADDEARTAAKVYLAVAKKRSGSKPSLGRLLSLQGRQMAGPTRNTAGETLYIPQDGPATLSYDSLRAPLHEGELLGEMSCMYRSPRSGTVVAKRECYMIEMLRNILDQIQKDPVYKSKTDELYKKRVLALQLRKLSLFSELTDEEFAMVRDNIELLTVEPGTLICDEHERSDSLFIVRSGLVKVIKNISWLIDTEDVLSWSGLCTALKNSEAQPATPIGKIWALLPVRVTTLLRHAADPGQLSSSERVEILVSLNDLLKSPKLIDEKELQPLKDTSPLREAAKALLEERANLQKKKKELPDADTRKLNRLLLEAVFSQAIRSRAKHGGAECVLSYLSRGDYFGEIGLMLKRPSNATCIAYGHPNDYGQVELAKISAELFWKLVTSSDKLRDKLKVEIALRRKQSVERLLTPFWDESNPVQFSEQFEQLGLIQGQKLMLIDLDRCTRCDECVKACVNTHDDGRSRLFLDGPRFGKYLVPTTCRSCLDPVCMIGCPVGSIHRGDNREIVIEDWCIGCGLCGDSCPYGSIQMHDLGIIPENARAWRYLPASAVKGDKWKGRKFNDAGWLMGDAPFALDRSLRDELAERRPRGLIGAAVATDAICFRYEFHLTKQMLSEAAEMLLEIKSLAPAVNVWINGQEVQPEGKPKRDGTRIYPLPLKPTAAAADEKPAAPPPLYAGTNCLAVQVTQTANHTDILMQARLDEVRRPKLPDEVDKQIAQEIEEKLVTSRAVVCDMCSGLAGQVPACVNACPHDAAMRVNAQFEFPK
jgi:Fe-S-cluster-containing hydrogenase component 2/CRP-like cAMP-binding protein